MSWNDPRNDLHLTSTGVAHHHHHHPAVRRSRTTPEHPSWPPAGFTRSVRKPLPPPLDKVDSISTKDNYHTTHLDFHTYPYLSDLPRNNDIMRKAPGHWNVDYTEDTIKKAFVKPQRRALTMGSECSEMKHQFSGKPGICLESMFSSDLQPQNYRHHHTGGPVKQLVPSTRNAQLAGVNFNISDRGVLGYQPEMYLTTTHKDHRSFPRSELSAYPRKEYGTYWECEGYPKAWGHGSKTNPLPPDSVQREPGPMRDATWFKTKTKLPRLPKSFQHVPNKGMLSETSAHFTQPTDEARQVLFHLPVPTPHRVNTGTVDQIFSIPDMYKSEYQYYGGNRPVNVGSR